MNILVIAENFEKFIEFAEFKFIQCSNIRDFKFYRHQGKFKIEDDTYFFARDVESVRGAKFNHIEEVGNLSRRHDYREIKETAEVLLER